MLDISITTEATWWDCLYENWDDIYKLLEKYCKCESLDDMVVAKEAEHFGGIIDGLFDVWYEDLTNTGVYTLPGWEAICALCEDVWVFDN